MALSVLNGDYHINGTLSSKILNPPPGSIRNDDIEQNTGVEASKLQHPNRFRYVELSSTTSSTLTIPVYVGIGVTGVLQNFLAGAVVANLSGATVDVDLLKNGTTVLSAPINLNDTHSNYEVVAGTISDTTFTTDDVYEIDVTATAGGGTLSMGLFCIGRIYESAT